VAPFRLTHHVIRAGRDVAHEVTDHVTLDDAQRAAGLAAEFTTVGAWRQEIIHTATGERWLRTRGIGWSRHGD
jgi:hypothetical protein